MLCISSSSHLCLQTGSCHSLTFGGARGSGWMSGSMSFAKERLCYFVPLRVFVCPFPFFSYCVCVPFSLEERSYVAEKMLNDL